MGRDAARLIRLGSASQMTHILLRSRERSGTSVARPQHFLKVAFALLGALILALPLAACGRKGPLDPPPGGYAFDPGLVRTPVSKKGGTSVHEQEKEDSKEKEPTFDEEGRPLAPAGTKKRLPGDWLLN